VGLVFQNPDDQLFCPTVADEVAFGPRNMGVTDPELKARIEQALQAVDMAGFDERSAHHLSFGQRKRVATATVISMQPEIWAFDEPSANVDFKTNRMLSEFIDSLDRTVIIVTQDLYFAAETCDRLVIVQSGAVRADGSTRYILEQPELLQKHDLGFGHHCKICEKFRTTG